MLRPGAALAILLTLAPSTVHAFDHHDHHFGSHDHDFDTAHDSSGGGGCGGERAEEPAGASVKSPTPSPAAPDPSGTRASGAQLRVFVTSEVHAGDLGGIAGADAACQAAASAHGWDGVYRAWLSDAKTSAAARVLSSGPWYTAGGDVAFATRADLANPPRVAILDEAGGTAHAVWSGSDTRGEPTGEDCSAWTSAKSGGEATTGLDEGAFATWGGGGLLGSCDTPRALVCIAE